MRHLFDPNLDCAPRDTQGDGFCQYGTAILSRHPVRPRQRAALRLPTRAAEEPRGLARVLIDVAGRPVEIFNTHLSFVESTRVRQMRYLEGLLRRDRHAFVLAGDLNALPFGRSWSACAGWRATRRSPPVARTCAPPPWPTPCAWTTSCCPVPPIDGPSQRIEALDARVVYGPRVSDHRPLVARLRIPAGP